ncbi:MAG: beta-galactosidase, partial [Pseudomonadota bacterium]
PIIHNSMGAIVDFDHFDVGKDLDIASWDSYPLGFLLDRIEASDDYKLTHARQGHPDFQAFHHDLYRAVGRGSWWVMEQQPGPVNWAPWNPSPLPGMVRLWTWEALAHGAEVVSYFRWRQAPFAQEQMHAGLLRPDRAPAEGLLEAQRVAGELKNFGEIEIGKAPAALVFDYPSAWAWDIQPQGRDFSYFGLVFDAYCALRRAGLSIDIRPPEAGDLGDYKLVLIPGLFSWTEALREQIAGHSGVVMAGPRSGSKTSDFAIPDRLPPDMDGIDLRVARTESLPPGLSEPFAEGPGRAIKWLEQLECDARVVLKTEKGAPVLVEQDGTFYLGAWPDTDGWDRVVAILADMAGLKTEAMTGGLRLRDTETHRFVFNYGPEAQDYDGRMIAVGELAWWKR